jgi:4-hydroxythreonine-4-phosphate dehydrogenase
MVPFKLLAFKDGVNFTAGLPIIRTSPAHGTAFDLMRTKTMPDCTSMHAAIQLALELNP